jgi:hypothetical protein
MECGFGNAEHRSQPFGGNGKAGLQIFEFTEWQSCLKHLNEL